MHPRFLRRWLLAALLLPMFMLPAACSVFGETPPSRFWLLQPLAAGSTGSTQLSITVGPVTIPAALDRPQLVTRLGPHQRHLAELDRWAGALHTDIASVLAQNLSVLLDTTDVSLFPSALGGADRRVLVDVVRFEATPGGESELIARWRLVDEARDVLTSGSSTHHAPVNGEDAGAIVAAMSRNLESLARDIAVAILAN